MIAFRRYFTSDESWGAVFTVAADGAPRQITDPPRGVVDDFPVSSADGTLIAFTRLAPDALCHIFRMAPDGSGLAPIGPLCPDGADEHTCSDDGNPTFSPDSKRVVFTQSTGRVKLDSSGENWIEHSALAIMRTDGSKRRVIYRAAPFSGDIIPAAFSPDGRRLVIEQANSGFSKLRRTRAVVVIEIDGSSRRRLTDWAENAGDRPAWSPDGSWILFHSHVEDGAQGAVLHRPPGRERAQAAHALPGRHLDRTGVLLARRGVDRLRQGARGRYGRGLHDAARREPCPAGDALGVLGLGAGLGPGVAVDIARRDDMRKLFALTCAVGLALAVAAPAQATFPAETGRSRSRRRTRRRATRRSTRSTPTAPACAHHRAEDGSPAWSADGRWLAFHDYSDEANGGVHLWVQRADGSHKHQVSFGGKDQGYPAWSPDGTRLAIDGNWLDSHSPDGFHSGVGILDLRTGKMREITSTQGVDGFPVWSPDGRLIVFQRFFETPQARTQRCTPCGPTART